MLHEPFLFGPASRCHQERPYFQSWLLSPADAAPDFPAGGPPPAAAAAAASYGPDARPGQSPGRLEALGGRLGRRKGSGPKKERRRTESINSAFAELRECIPNVPADTKLSKIKTLRLATSYIAYLMDVLAKDAQAGDPEAFKAELKKADGGRESKRKRELQLGFGLQGLVRKQHGMAGKLSQLWLRHWLSLGPSDSCHPVSPEQDAQRGLAGHRGKSIYSNDSSSKCLPCVCFEERMSGSC
ncbi:hypothetical protein MJT46_007302 [Ovis ammon polii x Ovis aries]|nr:hypothetical protein MJT46_007302 [Ovis ammon polii x Ovis aries]